MSDGIKIVDDESGLSVHYDGNDVGAIVSSLAGLWPRICSRADSEILRLNVAAPQRIVVLVRPDAGFLFFTLESGGKFVHEVGSATIQFLEDAFLNCEEEDEIDTVSLQLREIVRESFRQLSGEEVAKFDLPIAVDDYDSVDPSTFEMLTP